MKLEEIKSAIADVRRAHGPPTPLQRVVLFVPKGAGVLVVCPFCGVSWKHAMEEWVTWRAADMDELTRIVGQASERFLKHWPQCEVRLKTAGMVYTAVEVGLALAFVVSIVVGLVLRG